MINNRKIFLGVGIAILSLLLNWCYNIVCDYNKEESPVLISTEHNGICGAEQDIKVITFNKAKLQDYNVQVNEDGSIDVSLHIDKDNIDKK